MDIPTSQSVLKQRYTEKTNSQNNDDKAKKPTRSSHSISVNYCNIFAYFHVMNVLLCSALLVFIASSITLFLKNLFPSKQRISQRKGHVPLEVFATKGHTELLVTYQLTIIIMLETYMYTPVG